MIALLTANVATLPSLRSAVLTSTPGRLPVRSPLGLGLAWLGLAAYLSGRGGPLNGVKGSGPSI